MRNMVEINEIVNNCTDARPMPYPNITAHTIDTELHNPCPKCKMKNGKNDIKSIESENIGDS